jgi:nucleotide-binding universal stress UspA family protein
MATETPRLILVPMDFSEAAASALRYATALAARIDAHLLVMYADPFLPVIDFMAAPATSFDIPREEMIGLARERLQLFAEANVSASVPYDVRVVIGRPVEAIPAQVAETGAGLIVMGTHGRSDIGRLVFGSVTEAMMRVAKVPVIAVHAATPAGSAQMRVVIGPRVSAEDEAALAYAGMLADREEARFVEIEPHSEILAAADRERADLIVLGIGERRPLDPFRRNATERIVQQSVCPVLTVNGHGVRQTAPSPAVY